MVKDTRNSFKTSIFWQIYIHSLRHKSVHDWISCHKAYCSWFYFWVTDPAGVEKKSSFNISQMMKNYEFKRTWVAAGAFLYSTVIGFLQYQNVYRIYPFLELLSIWFSSYQSWGCWEKVIFQYHTEDEKLWVTTAGLVCSKWPPPSILKNNACKNAQRQFNLNFSPPLCTSSDSDVHQKSWLKSSHHLEEDFYTHIAAMALHAH